MSHESFDALTRALAAVTSRRQALGLLVGGIAAAAAALAGARDLSAKGTCRPAGSRCRKGEKCCGGTCCGGVCCDAGQVCQDGQCVTPSSGPNRLGCFCQYSNGEVLPSYVCTTADCLSGLEQDAVCAPLCASQGGALFATGCFPDDPTCTG